MPRVAKQYHADFIGNAKLSTIIAYFSYINFFVLLVSLCYDNKISLQQLIFLLIFAGATAVILFFRRRSNMIVFLLSTFTMVVVWRLCGLANLTLLTYLYGLNILLKLFSYLACSYKNIRAGKLYYEWQLFFIRLFIGLDMIPHFCEKLFAGSAIRAMDLKAFTALGVPHSFAFVILAGLIEFFAALAISSGFLTRLASSSFVIYLLVASYLGHHFANGFIWASAGGGWEYPMLLLGLFAVFATLGAGGFSIDAFLQHRFALPSRIRFLMGTTRDK